jgi:hypothetical protein
MKISEISDLDWITIPPNGGLAIARHPLLAIPEGCRLATGAEFLCANRGNPFPWGNLPKPHAHHRHWHERRLGIGGLFHHRWFVTSDGRLGGADNVPTEPPGSLRSSLLYDGGGLPTDQLAENEGYAVVRETSEADRRAFREMQMYAATHVMADGGAIISSPITEQGMIYVGFVGRCQICPNAELISFQQLRAALPHYTFELWPEWRNWSIGIRSVA